ncbi:hypothetical protein C8R46DRAFT_1232930 [Mycena filopes]|nr:hypothetical protein C8R46DRAFT_1360612 [Mycena filopes]KAJ7143462.1 hypothetical protein C8R46DRAFT_1232930 [Mycena filopes]
MYGYNVDTATPHLQGSNGHLVLDLAGGTIAKTGCEVNGWDEFWLRDHPPSIPSTPQFPGRLRPTSNDPAGANVKSLGKVFNDALRLKPGCPIELLGRLSSKFTRCAESSWFKILQLVTPQLNCPIEFLGELSSRFTECEGSSWFKVLQVTSGSSTSGLLTRSGSLIELVGASMCGSNP